MAPSKSFQRQWQWLWSWRPRRQRTIRIIVMDGTIFHGTIGERSNVVLYPRDQMAPKPAFNVALTSCGILNWWARDDRVGKTKRHAPVSRSPQTCGRTSFSKFFSLVSTLVRHEHQGVWQNKARTYWHFQGMPWLKLCACTRYYATLGLVVILAVNSLNGLNILIINAIGMITNATNGLRWYPAPSDLSRTCGLSSVKAVIWTILTSTDLQSWTQRPWWTLLFSCQFGRFDIGRNKLHRCPPASCT
jgi:hypothetical protein